MSKKKQATKKNYDLAKQIIEGYARITKEEGTGFYDIDLISVIGYRRTTEFKSRDKAIDYMAEWLGQELDDGNLTLSDTWIDENIERQGA